MFNSQRKKLNHIKQNSNKLNYDIDAQEIIHNSNESEFDKTQSSLQLFKKSRDFSVDWEEMEVPSNHVSDLRFNPNYFKTWDVEFEGIAEKWIPFDVEVLYRNSVLEDDSNFLDPNKSVFYEVEDIENSTEKKVTLHAGLHFDESLSNDPINPPLDAKLLIQINNPYDFI